MLLFYCAEETDLPVLRRDGARATGKGSFSLWPSLEAARAACDALILVVEVPATTGYIPPDAFYNLDPYLPPEPVVAAGGYVVRPGRNAPEVLLIFRRGVWDLPKGKRDPGETVEACALREVREEVGVTELHLGPALGTTLHGYPRGGGYHVKTTYWFLMRTPEEDFVPDAREGIEVVTWMPWPEAVRRIGYATFRTHMRQVEPVVRSALRDG